MVDNSDNCTSRVVPKKQKMLQNGSNMGMGAATDLVTMWSSWAATMLTLIVTPLLVPQSGRLYTPINPTSQLINIWGHHSLGDIPSSCVTPMSAMPHRRNPVDGALR
ncbi:hypothetical protein ACLOJK_024027, partial [Asimina triloba]